VGHEFDGEMSRFGDGLSQGSGRVPRHRRGNIVCGSLPPCRHRQQPTILTRNAHASGSIAERAHSPKYITTAREQKC